MPDKTILTLGISPCPNDVYIFSGLLLGAVSPDGFEFRVDYQDVETLNARAQAGTMDVVKISYANYVHCADTYDLLPCGGALGRGVGPLLLSSGGDWNPDGEVLVPGEFTTANFLLDFYAGRPLRKRFLPFDTLYAALLETPGMQGVVIHEKRFTYAADGLHLIQDLGDHWEHQTGFAIPLGAIAARKELDQAALAAAVRDSLRWAYAHDAEAFALCREYSQDLNPEVVLAHIALYVNSFSEDVGPEGSAAVEFFLTQQREFSAVAAIRYKSPDFTSKPHVEAVITRNDPQELAPIVIGVSLYAPDLEWAQAVCVRLAASPDYNVRGNAILGFGHLVRRFGRLSQPILVKQLIESGLKDPHEFVRGQAQSASEDVSHFLK